MLPRLLVREQISSVPIDISLANWLSEPERGEQDSIIAEIRNQTIAADVGQKCLQTASLDWEALFISASPPGAMTPVVARETLTTAATRRRWERQKQLRSGHAGLLRAIRAA